MTPLAERLLEIDAQLSLPEPERPDWGGFLLLPLFQHGMTVEGGAPVDPAAPPTRETIDETSLERTQPGVDWSVGASRRSTSAARRRSPASAIGTAPSRSLSRPCSRLAGWPRRRTPMP